MSDIYAYNPKVKYTPPNWSGGGINSGADPGFF